MSSANAVHAVGVIGTITVGGAPEAITYDAGRNEIFVTNLATNTVSTISISNNTLVANVTVGNIPEGVAYDSGTGEIFV